MQALFDARPDLVGSQHLDGFFRRVHQRNDGEALSGLLHIVAGQRPAQRPAVLLKGWSDIRRFFAWALANELQDAGGILLHHLRCIQLNHTAVLFDVIADKQLKRQLLKFPHTRPRLQCSFFPRPPRLCS